MHRSLADRLSTDLVTAVEDQPAEVHVALECDAIEGRPHLVRRTMIQCTLIFAVIPTMIFVVIPDEMRDQLQVFVHDRE